MIIAFMESVEGVLLACTELIKNPDCELISARDRNELKKKMDFEGIEEVKTVGFKVSSSTSCLSGELFGRKHPRMFRRDPDAEGYVSLVLRHGSLDPVEFVRFLCSCRGNVELLYSCKTVPGKKYYGYMRDVSRAYQRLCMFARPFMANGLLCVRIDSPHKIGDMFCRWLSRKNPDLPVSVIQGDMAWIGNGNYVGLENNIRIPASLLGSIEYAEADADKVDEMWDMYYDSQFIPKRRNKDNARKFQPKYCESMSKMAQRDSYKVEKGINNCTLDSFRF